MSHTGNVGKSAVWPLHAARQFAQTLRQAGVLDRTWRLRCELYREPGTAGRDRDIERAVMRGLEDDDAKRPGLAGTAYQHRGLRDKRELRLIGERRITFDLRHHFSYVAGHGTCALPGPMRLSLSAFDPGATLLLQRSYTGPEMDRLARGCDTLRSQVEARSQLPATC